MGRLCGGAHEISGIKAPFFLHGWVVGGGVDGGLGVVVGGQRWWGVWYWVGGVVGWVGVGGGQWGGVGGRWCVWCAGEGCCGWWMKGG